MRKILIWTEYCYGSHADIWRIIDYSKLFEEINMYCGGAVDNAGNKVWFQGLISEISTDENKIYLRDPAESWETVNKKYDLIVYSAANLISAEHRRYIGELAESFSHSRIPVYFISIGAQEKSYDNIHDLYNAVRLELDKLIKAVYMCGGEFGLRGYFTKEVFDKVSENTAEVIGCPSMYQNGSDLFIEKKMVSEKEFKPIVNGWSKLGSDGMIRYKKSIFIDQDEMFEVLYNLNFYKNMDDKSIFERLVRRIGYLNVKLLVQDRIKLFYDIPQWRRFILSGCYSFSYGSRIHGNIMSILSGIPCVIYTKDARTRELAEFYEIPHYTKEPDSTLWEEFLKADYTGFNRTYKRQYEKFRQFLVSHNIVDDINTNNNFWNKDDPTANKAIEAILMRMNGFVETDNHYMSQCAKKYSGKKFVIFGAGNLGEEAAKLLGEENVKCFVDNDAAKQKSGYLGFEVFSLDKVSIEKNKDLLIIAVSERYIDDIIAQLDHKEISNYYTIKEVKSDLALGRNEVTDFGL